MRATAEGSGPGTRRSIAQGTMAPIPGTRASAVTMASGRVRKAEASGSANSRRPAGRWVSRARKSATYSAVRLLCPFCTSGVFHRDHAREGVGVAERAARSVVDEREHLEVLTPARVGRRDTPRRGGPEAEAAGEPGVAEQRHQRLGSMDSCGSADGDGQPVRAASSTASTTCMVRRPSRAVQIGLAAPRITSTKWAIWPASGSLRTTLSVEVVKGAYQDRSPRWTFSRIVGTDSEPVVPAMWYASSSG